MVDNRHDEFCCIRDRVCSGYFDDDDTRWLIAEVERLTAERDRYKAWCAGVMAQESVSVCTTKSGDLMMIERPKPLKENE